MTLSNLLATVGGVLEQLLTWVASVFNTAIESPVVQIFICLAIIGAVVGFAKKLLHV